MLAKVAVIAEKGNNYTTSTPGRSVELGLQHLEKYEIFIESQSNKRLIAKIEIDGKRIGEFIIQSRGGLRLLGVPNQEGEFTFIAHGTQEFLDTKLVNSYSLGMVEVTVTPEKTYEYTPKIYEKSLTMGVTRGGTNKQAFKYAHGFETDDRKTEVFVFKLVHKETEVKPLVVNAPLADMSVFGDLLSPAYIKYDAVFTNYNRRAFTVTYIANESVSKLLEDLVARRLLKEIETGNWEEGKVCATYEIRAHITVNEFFDKIKAALVHFQLNLKFVP
jgi:hypothetical protein